MKRPTGVTILAMFLILNAVMLALHAAVLYSHPNIGAGFTNSYLKHIFPIDRYDAVSILWGSIVGSIILLVIGGGLWFLQDNARWGVLLVTGIPLGRGLIAAVTTLLMDRSHFSRNFPDGFWIRTLINGLIVLYLVRPDVRNAFGPPDRYTGLIDSKKKDTVDYSGS